MRSNTELARDAQSGDTDAFGLFFERNRGWVYRKAWHFLRDPEDAQDAVSDIFCKALQRLSQWRDEGLSFDAWFTKVCTNTLIDIHRVNTSQVRKQIRLATEAEIPVIAKVSDRSQAEPLTSLVSEELILEIEDILCQMPEGSRRQRLVWYLMYIEGYSDKEIGKMLGIAPNTARVHARRCNLKLRRALRQKGLVCE